MSSLTIHDLYTPVNLLDLEGQRCTVIRMPENDTETRNIEIKGRTYPTVQVTESQVVVMARVEAQIRRLGRTNRDINNDPAALRQAQSLAIRATSIVAGCFADPDDWTDVEEMMAMRQITWEEVLDIIAQVGKVWADEEVPANRAAKRAVKKATRA